MIVVFGNTPVDLIAEVSDDFLEFHGLAKGVCTTVSRAKQEELKSAIEYKTIPGGSGANLAASLALLGEDVRFIGGFGNDPIGDLARESLESLGIVCTPYRHRDLPNEIVFIFLTPDGERSFATFYDTEAGVPIEAMDVSDARFVVVDGYTLHYPRYQAALLKKMHTIDTLLVFCPNDVSVVTHVPEVSRDLYQRCGHVLMNRDEAKLLLHPHKTETIMSRLQDDRKSGALTMGAEGAFVFTPDETLAAPSVLDPQHFVDSNGAGDAFTAGYLYGLAQNWSLEKTGKAASACAAVVLSTRGARAPGDLRARVAKEIA